MITIIMEMIYSIIDNNDIKFTLINMNDNLMEWWNVTSFSNILEIVLLYF